MTGTRRALVVSAGIAICLWVASLDFRPAENRKDPPPRHIEFQPLATRSDNPGTPVFLDAPEGKVKAEQEMVRVREGAGTRPAYRHGALAARLKAPEVPLIRKVQSLAVTASAVSSIAIGPDSDGAGDVYVPGCVGYAKRFWATGEAVPNGAGTPGSRRNCSGGPPREIVLEPMLGGMCANPEKDRGLPSMCAQSRRRR